MSRQPIPPRTRNVGLDAIGVVDFTVTRPVLEAVPIEVDRSVDELAEKIVRRFIAVCEHPMTRPLVTRLSKGSVADARGPGQFAKTMTRLVYDRLGRRARSQLSLLRLELVIIQLAGVAIARYGLELEPMASLPREELVALMIPSVSAALTSDTTVEPDFERQPVVSPAWNARSLYKATGRLGY